MSDDERPSKPLITGLWPSRAGEGTVDMSDDRLTPDRAVRLLRAHAAQLEIRAMRLLGSEASPTAEEEALGVLVADIALIAVLLADEIERREQ